MPALNLSSRNTAGNRAPAAQGLFFRTVSHLSNAKFERENDVKYGTRDDHTSVWTNVDGDVEVLPVPTARKRSNADDPAPVASSSRSEDVTPADATASEIKSEASKGQSAQTTSATPSVTNDSTTPLSKSAAAGQPSSTSTSTAETSSTSASVDEASASAATTIARSSQASPSAVNTATPFSICYGYCLPAGHTVHVTDASALFTVYVLVSQLTALSLSEVLENRTTLILNTITTENTATSASVADPSIDASVALSTSTGTTGSATATSPVDSALTSATFVSSSDVASVTQSAVSVGNGGKNSGLTVTSTPAASSTASAAGGHGQNNGVHKASPPPFNPLSGILDPVTSFLGQGGVKTTFPVASSTTSATSIAAKASNGVLKVSPPSNPLPIFNPLISLLGLGGQGGKQNKSTDTATAASASAAQAPPPSDLLTGIVAPLTSLLDLGGQGGKQTKSTDAATATASRAPPPSDPFSVIIDPLTPVLGLGGQGSKTTDVVTTTTTPAPPPLSTVSVTTSLLASVATQAVATQGSDSDNGKSGLPPSNGETTTSTTVATATGADAGAVATTTAETPTATGKTDNGAGDGKVGAGQVTTTSTSDLAIPTLLPNNAGAGNGVNPSAVTAATASFGSAVSGAVTPTTESQSAIVTALADSESSISTHLALLTGDDETTVFSSQTSSFTSTIPVTTILSNGQTSTSKQVITGILTTVVPVATLGPNGQQAAASSQPGTTNHTAVAVGGAIGGVILLIVGFVLCLFLRKRRRNQALFLSSRPDSPFRDAERSNPRDPVFSMVIPATSSVPSSVLTPSMIAPSETSTNRRQDSLLTVHKKPAPSLNDQDLVSLAEPSAQAKPVSYTLAVDPPTSMVFDQNTFAQSLGKDPAWAAVLEAPTASANPFEDPVNPFADPARKTPLPEIPKHLRMSTTSSSLARNSESNLSPTSTIYHEGYAV